MPAAVVPVHWELATDDKMKAVVQQGIEYATPDWAHSIHAEPYGLEAGRDYWYRFTAGGVRSPIGHTHTAPGLQSSIANLRIALANCQQYEQGFYTAYRHMLDDNLDFIIHVGDYIYETSWGDNFVRRHNAPTAFTLDDYRIRHALYKTDPDLQAAHAACPWLVVWDDHDVANDYAGDISEYDDDPEAFRARRAGAYRAYYEHMPLPRQAVPFGPDMRLYMEQMSGNLASIFMLDQRQFRSPEACPLPGKRGGHRVSNCPELDDPNRTMLGARQESWLQGRLAVSNARWNILAEGTVMSYMDEDPPPGKASWTDAWNGYPAARDKLIHFLADRKIANPIVLSGDIHSFVVSGLHLNAADLASPVVATEFTATSISSQGPGNDKVEVWRRNNPNLLLVDGEHRGYLRLDLSHERAQADLIVIESEKKAGAARKTLASFVVEAGKPGPTRV
jgi:alkaline phosphatase D